ncbi:MAG: hypothetical protein K6A23_02690 [Butyrivibrio sp.]|nr:hypothetical protein [Butyrivibrio sp.]
MVRKKLVKITSIALILALSASTTACGSAANNETAKMVTQETVNEDKLEETMNASSFGSSNTDAGKVETVYVMANNEGSVNEVIVSDWLKNTDASATISDASTLSDIVNVKGNETYTENADGSITWNANGSDIYYQGTTSEELPVSVKISYKLDGKDITPQELAGKSGNVTIRFDYTNSSKKTVDIDGEETDIYTPFAMISGVMLDSSKFTNVEVTNGKVVTDSNNYVVMGVALPGLKESLNLNEDKLDELEIEEDINIPESVEITAYTNGFEMPMTLTMATSDALSDLGFTGLSNSNSIDKVQGDMDELQDGSTKLVDGSGELLDGTKELKDGTQELADGAVELKDGTKKLSDGTNDLYDGLSEYTEGVSKVNDGAAQLDSGASELNSGIATAKSGADQLKSGMDSSNLVSSAQALADGTKALKEGVDTAVSTLNSSLSSVSTEMTTSEQAATLAAGYLAGTVTPDSSTYTAINSALALYTSSIADQVVSSTGNETLSALKASGDYIQFWGAVKSAKSSYESEAAKYYTALLSAKIDAATTSAYEKTYSVMMDYLASEAAIETETGTVTDSETVSKDSSETEDVEEVTEDNTEESENSSKEENTEENTDEQETDEEVAEEDKSGDQESEDSNEDGDSQEDDTEESSEDITDENTENSDETEEEDLEEAEEAEENTENVKQSKKVTATYNSDTTSGSLTETQLACLSAYKQYSEGAAALSTAITTAQAACTAGAGTLDTMITKMSGMDLSGLAKLQAGATELATKTQALPSGITKLYNGMVALDDGLAKIQTGSQQLKDGTATLYDGTSTLASNNSTLMDGALKLKDGASELYDGTVTLQDGTTELNDVAGKLLDGVQELKDGMVKFDEEGIQKLSSAFDGDIQSFADRLQAIEDASREYTSFSGVSDDTTGSVKFIIKTDGINL